MRRHGNTQQLLRGLVTSKQNISASMQLDEVRRQSGGKAGLPAVPEEEDEEPPQSAAGFTQQQTSAISAANINQPDAVASLAIQQHQLNQQQSHQQHTIQQSQRLEDSQREWQANGQEEQTLQPTVPSLHAQAGMLEQADDCNLLPASSQPAHQQSYTQVHEGSMQQPTGLNHAHGLQLHSSRQEKQTNRQQVVQQAVQQPYTAAQQPAQQRLNRPPASPMFVGSRSPQTAEGSRSPPVPQDAVVSPARAAGNRPTPLRAGAKAPVRKTSPVMAHAVEHSSLSLSQLAGASRSKLRLPSNLNSPPKRASKAALPRQATNSQLVKLAAAVPLPASPNGDGKVALEPTAAVALATAVAKPSHIPAPAVKPSRLKKPANTSGFFSSGRSFTSGGSNSRYLSGLVS